MLAIEIIQTLRNFRRGGGHLSDERFTDRQWLYLVDLLRARLLVQRRRANPQLWESCQQYLPLLTPNVSPGTGLTPGCVGGVVGPLPEPISGPYGPGFTFVGIPGGVPLSALTMMDLRIRQGDRYTAKDAAYLWNPMTRVVELTHKLADIGGKLLIGGVWARPLEAALFQKTGAALRPVRPLEVEYPFPAELVDALLKLAAEHEKLSTLLPADVENDGADTIQPANAPAR